MAIEAAGAFVTRRADFPPAIFFAVSAEDDVAQTGAAHSLVSSAPQPQRCEYRSRHNPIERLGEHACEPGLTNLPD